MKENMDSDEIMSAVSLGAQAVGDEMALMFQDINTKVVYKLWLGRGDAFLLSRNIQDAIEDTAPVMNAIQQFPVGSLVKALYPNERWGSGVVIGHDASPKMKPVVVQRGDNEVGFFHVDQIAIVIPVADSRTAE